MRATDWGGDPPANTAQAKQKLIEATLACVNKYGLPKTYIKTIADELGITRQTFYRYFPTLEMLLAEASLFAGGSILEKLRKNANRFERFEDKTIETIIVACKAIPEDPYISQFFSTSSERGKNIDKILNEASLEYTYQFLSSMYAPHEISTQEAKWLKGLAEHVLRLLLTLIVMPSAQTRSPKELRNYLNLWLKPLLKFPG